jgi:phage baseplate assembly protein W
MAAINFSGLEASVRPNYIYRDFHFDLEGGNIASNNNLYRSEQTTDIMSKFDEGAITNSLINIFNTMPGEKILSPGFGLYLKRYLFDPVSVDIAENIGDDIVSGIERYEPRVRLDDVSVLANIDTNEYVINLTITIPPLNISQKQLPGLLNQNGFSFL